MGEKCNLLSCIVTTEKSRQCCINEKMNHSLFIKCQINFGNEL